MTELDRETIRWTLTEIAIIADRVQDRLAAQESALPHASRNVDRLLLKSGCTSMRLDLELIIDGLDTVKRALK